MKKAQLFEFVLALLLAILGCLLYLAIVSTPQASGSWETPLQVGGGSAGGFAFLDINYMLVGSGDMLYMFQGNKIFAIRPDGANAWTLDVPWDGCNYEIKNLVDTDGRSGYGWTIPYVDESAGHLYVYSTASESDLDKARLTGDYSGVTYTSYKIIAISPRGKIEWMCPIQRNLSTEYQRFHEDDLYDSLSDTYYVKNIVDIQVYGDRLYMFHDDSEDVIGLNGTLLYTIGNISGPVAVDENGFAYAVRATIPEVPGGDPSLPPEQRLNETLKAGEDLGRMFTDPDYRVPSGTINAYMPNGSLAWSRDIGERAVRTPYMSDGHFLSSPIYVNNTLYIPVENGVAAMDTQGSLKWITHVPDGNYVVYRLMPADSEGNVYLNALDAIATTFTVVKIGRDGQIAGSIWSYEKEDGNKESTLLPRPIYGNNGTIYAVGSTGLVSSDYFDDILSSGSYGADTITAFNLKDNRTSWKFLIPEADRHTILLNDSNYLEALPGISGPTQGTNKYREYYPQLDTMPLTPKKVFKVDMHVKDNVTYVDYYYAIYEDPVIFNRSRALYAKAMYALDGNGSLIWEKPVDKLVWMSAAGNDTFYYMIGDGRLGGSSINAAVAAGLALTASLYLFFRFFMIGAVSRAKNVLHINENRNQLLDYIVDNPAVTARDIARGIHMNIGTLRYHLFILTVNHKLVTHQDGDKFVRYFKNSSAYTPEERTLLSLMRREPIMQTLEALQKKPGLSGPELARTLDVSDTVAYRYANLLVEKGIVYKEAGAERGYMYSINDQFLSPISRMSELL